MTPNEDVEYGELKATVGDHGRRLITVEGDVKEIVAFKNRWAGAMMLLQVATIALTLIALFRGVK